MRPEDIFPDAALAASLSAATDPDAPEPERLAGLQRLRDLLPSLHVLQLFDLFDPPIGTPPPQSS